LAIRQQPVARLGGDFAGARLRGPGSRARVREVPAPAADGARPGPRRRPPPLAAQAFHAKGLRAWAERTAPSLNGALDAFNAALRIDPDYAEALAGLANTFILLREYTLMPDAQAYPLAADAARRALALDDSLPQAHAALAFVEYWGHWDAAAAEREFERAIALGPNWATGRHWYATFLGARGQAEQGLAQIDLALRIDPNSLAMQADRGLLLFNAGRPDEAVTELRRVVAACPGLVSPHRYLAELYLLAGRDEDYLREARLTAGLVSDHAQLAALRDAEAAYGVMGHEGMLAALAADRTAPARSGTASAYSVARLCALAGDATGALVWAQKSFDKREADFVQIVFDTVLHRVLAGSPAFVALVEQVAPAVDRRPAPTRGLGGELAEVLDRSLHGLILLAPDGRLRHANLAAERLLAESGGLRITDGRLSAARAEDARRLQALVARAGAPDCGRAGGSMALQTPDRQLPLSVTIVPMTSERSQAVGADRSVLVCVTDLDAGVAMPEQQLREIFGLTPAEARLALALFEGLTPAEAAADFGLSLHTVRAQLARVFEKTGASRQSGLMRLMMSAVGMCVA
jgi:DNA-binding CsgD family transcriptional regulator/tetratricopeptide (TPR) repeat protein